AARRHP
ncbi:RNase adapter protein RapZ, partial [Candidatus Hakubella thermalkaliphila]